MKIKNLLTGLILTILISGQVFGQSQGVCISTDNSSPVPSAMLEIKSNDKGLLIPRMTMLERANIQNPAEGLMVYQTNDVVGFYYYTNGSWTSFVSTSQITDFGSGQVITSTERTKLNNDNDADATNEIQDLQLTGNILKITLKGNPTEIDLSPYIAGQWNETANGINYSVDNSSIEINQADTIFKVNGGVETDNQDGKDIVLRAGTTNSSTDNLDGGSILLYPGIGSGTGIDGNILLNGNVGIGLTNPTAKLNVFGSIKSESGSGYYSALSDNSIGFTRAGANYIDLYNGNLNVRNNGSDYLFTVKSDGNVGIGTTNPSVKLDVNGAINTNVGYLTNGADYAEYFESEETLNAGDVVGINMETGKVRKYQTGDKLVGVVSDNAGYIGNHVLGRNEDENYSLVGLSGQLKFDETQVIIENRIVKTLDNIEIGTLLSNGKVFIK